MSSAASGSSRSPSHWAASKAWSASPPSMTHASVPPERRAALGITEGLIRFSCGVEDVEDLLEDLDHAFKGL